MLYVAALIPVFAAANFVQAAPATDRLVRTYAPASSSSVAANSTQWYLAPTPTSSTTSAPATTTAPVACASYMGSDPLKGVAWAITYCHDHPECCPGGTTYTPTSTTPARITVAPTPNPSTVATVPVKIAFSTTEKAGAADGEWPYQELAHSPCPVAPVGTSKDDIEAAAWISRDVLVARQITIQKACDTWITVGDLNGKTGTFKVTGVCSGPLCTGDMVALPKYTAQQVFGTFEEDAEAKYALQGPTRSFKQVVAVAQALSCCARRPVPSFRQVSSRCFSFERILAASNGLSSFVMTGRTCFATLVAALFCLILKPTPASASPLPDPAPGNPPPPQRMPWLSYAQYMSSLSAASASDERDGPSPFRKPQVCRRLVDRHHHRRVLLDPLVPCSASRYLRIVDNVALVLGAGPNQNLKNLMSHNLTLKDVCYRNMTIRNPANGKSYVVTVQGVAVTMYGMNGTFVAVPTNEYELDNPPPRWKTIGLDYKSPVEFEIEGIDV
ncbi:Proteophosphoglycan ppg4 [Rhodotorula toruloides ATCC 204091]|uniref:Proteophosphoglycan ppg4 n=1 Tax=Rhodotorula toruloides TaxID=5286 RepID=A0A0K3CPP8_RHOTO|nr:Proteophosphoglycan ppg4 [Rhodotorula toruloides ATCC 204091]PRQ70690.1 Proteophosphoglycan ppg4 [Rhodotorula toruloides]